MKVTIICTTIKNITELKFFRAMKIKIELKLKCKDAKRK